MRYLFSLLLIFLLCGFISIVYADSDSVKINLISDSPINSNSPVLLIIETSGLTPNTRYYLVGTFFKDSSTNYFGLTNVNGSWVKNSASATSQFPITTDSTGSWVGSLEVRPDIAGTGFYGSGNYNFKVARYDSNGNNLTWSNSLTIGINFVATPASSSTPSPTISPTIKPSVLFTPTSHSVTLSGLINQNSASVEGIATEAASYPNQIIAQSFTGKKPALSWLLIGGGIFVVLAGGAVSLVKFTALRNLSIFNRLPGWF